jgi:hypothetical protein
MMPSVNPENGRMICSSEHPMPKGAQGRWEHTNAHETDYDSDYSAEYKCSDCGHIWREELPE